MLDQDVPNLNLGTTNKNDLSPTIIPLPLSCWRVYKDKIFELIRAARCKKVSSTRGSTSNRLSK